MIGHFGRDTVLEINLDAFEHNIQAFQSYLPLDTKILVAVKANAYGHGAVPMAKAAIDAGASYLGVAFVDEGIELRRAGIKLPILIFGHTPSYAVEDAINYHLALTVSSVEQGAVVSQIAQRNQESATIHLKIDTGMGRIGIQPSEAVAALTQLVSLPSLYIEGVYTHLATADHTNTEYLREQQRVFTMIIEQLRDKEISIPFIHIANSPGAIQIPNDVYTMVRLGISAYGHYPSEEMKKKIELRPILTLKSRISHIKKPSRGCGISYGATVRVTGDQWIATVPVGYGDGFPRIFSNKGFVLVSGQRVPIVGRVCMDQFMVDVTSVMPVKVGDEVVLYGEQGAEEISVDAAASQLGTIHYEVTTTLSHRIPRIYLRNGHIIEVVNALREK